MIDDAALKLSYERLDIALAELRRQTTILKMTLKDNPYRPLVRVMSKLKLINWRMI